VVEKTPLEYRCTPSCSGYFSPPARTVAAIASTTLTVTETSVVRLVHLPAYFLQLKGPEISVEEYPTGWNERVRGILA